MLLRLALSATLLTPIAHVIVLWSENLDAVTSPIIDLSRGPFAWIHSTGLLWFGLAHLCLAAALAGLDRGKLWPFARTLVAAAGVTLVYTAWFFATVPDSSSTVENDPLWIVASLIGIAMGALQPGLSRINRILGLYSAVFLGLWLWLVPLAFFVTDHWIGAYERLVGIVYVSWMTGVVAQLIRLEAGSPSDTTA
ncbi:MAG: hypothetical protein AAAFM81_06590 [Pseudomonadota bacterium]